MSDDGSGFDRRIQRRVERRTDRREDRRTPDVARTPPISSPQVAGTDRRGDRSYRGDRSGDRSYRDGRRSGSYSDTRRNGTYRDTRRDGTYRDGYRDGRRVDRRDDRRDTRSAYRSGYRDGRSTGYRDDHRRWDRRWRDNRRYNWYNYRQSNRSHYRLGRYYAPYRDYYYSRVSIGFFMDSLFYSNRYWVSDPWQYRLPPVYGPYRWVRYYDDVMLVNVYTGEVVDVIYDFFW